MRNFSTRCKIAYDVLKSVDGLLRDALSDAPGDKAKLKAAWEQAIEAMEIFMQGEPGQNYGEKIEQDIGRLIQEIEDYTQSTSNVKYNKSKYLKTALSNAKQASESVMRMVPEIKKGKTYDKSLEELTIFYELVLQSSDTSAAFNSIKECFKDFLSFSNETENPAKYRRALSKLLDSSEYYLQLHKKEADKPNPSDNVKLVKSLRDNLNNRLTLLETRRKNAVAEELRIVNEKLNQRGSGPEDLLLYTRLQRNIGPSKLIPVKPSFNPTPSKASRIWGKIKHGLFTALYATVGMVFGQIIALPLTIRNWASKAPAAAELAEDKIPGFKDDEKFDKYIPNPDPSKEKVLDDVRRIPLCYEQEIPGNPDDAPTISFNSHQGQEGDSRAMAGEGMGHGFITMEYSRMDPISGTMKRYRSSFGFYPKGGFQNSGGTSAMFMEGRHVPGNILNDAGHLASVGKQFVVNNTQINKIIVATQNYAKGGYNYFNRNCTSFVYDMSVVAGIDMSKDFVKSDIELSGSAKAGALALALGGGVIMKRMSTHDIYQKAGRKDLSYNKSGQNLVTESDIKLLEKDKFNARAEGYSPAHVAESMRQDDRGVYYTNLYKGPKEVVSDGDKIDLTNACILEFNNLIASIEAIGAASGTNLSAETNQLEVYGRNFINIITENFCAYIGEKDYTKLHNIIVQGSELVKEFTEGLSDIYINTYKNDPRLNIPFMHIISTVNQIRNEYDSAFKNLQKGTYKDVTISEAYKQSQIDHSRDIDEALLNFKFSTFGYSPVGDNVFVAKNDKHVSLTPARAAAMVQAYGSLNKGLCDVLEYKHLSIEKKLTSKQQARLTKLDLANRLVDNFEAAQKYYMGKKSYSDNEMKFIFKDLTKAEAEVGLKTFSYDSNSMRASLVYQLAALETVLGGSKTEISEYVSNHVNTRKAAFLERMQQEPYKDNPAELVKLADEVFKNSRVEIQNKLMDDMLAKLEKKPEFMNKAVSYMAEALNGDKSAAFDRLMQTMTDAYIAPLAGNSAWQSIKDIPQEIPNIAKDKMWLPFKNVFLMQSLNSNPQIAEKLNTLKTAVIGPQIEKTASI